MRFTRRRWDLCAGLVALSAALAAGLSGWLDGAWPPKLLIAPLIALPFVAMRFRIPRDGFESTALTQEAPAFRRLIASVVFGMLAIHAVLFWALFTRHSPWYAVAVGVPCLALTFTLAVRADQARMKR